MSGIFKGESIYKNGSGGGGYKDGGELVDNDFIEVENNTNSSYNNETRDPVNFYFEVKEGEVLNSVIELTTTINSTINVYVVKNNLYYPLGNVGGNNVNAGDDYKINIVGDSYTVEQVTYNSQNPVAVVLKGHRYGIVNIDGKYYTTSDLKSPIGNTTGVGEVGEILPYGQNTDTIVYGGSCFYDSKALEKFNKDEFDGWDLIPNDDPIFTNYKIGQLIVGGSTGFNAYKNGNLNRSFFSGHWRFGGKTNPDDCLIYLKTKLCFMTVANTNNYATIQSDAPQGYRSLRLCKTL